MPPAHLYILALGAVALTCSPPSLAQRPVAFVPVAEATTSGSLRLAGDQTLLGPVSEIHSLPTAAAHVSLARGGEMLLCPASGLRLNSAQLPPGLKFKDPFDPLVIDLSAGAVELRMPIELADAIVASSGMRIVSPQRLGKSAPISLALRLTPTGDTCVENRALQSSPLTLMDALGHTAYALKPGEHVLFQHGLIREAVSSITSSCGCPPPPTPGFSIVDAALRAGAGSTPTFAAKADPFPFPSTIAPADPSPDALPASSGSRLQLAGTLLYDPAAVDPLGALTDAASSPDPAPPLPPQPTLVAAAAPLARRRLFVASTPGALTASSPPPVNPRYKQTLSTPFNAPEPRHGVLHSMGGFFKNLLNP